MISRYTADVTSQRMQETEQAILEQKRYVESLADPGLRAIAMRTLTTLEDILLIMQRTRIILLATAADADEQADPADEPRCGQAKHCASPCHRLKDNGVFAARASTARNES